MKLSIVILAMTTNEELIDTTLCGVNSLIEPEPDISNELIVIESNKNYFSSSLQYPAFLKFIIPGSNLNFRKFLDIGINKAVGDFVALCNNDLIFEHYWSTDILKDAYDQPKIISFSPGTTGMMCDNSIIFEIEYKVRTHIMRWCVVGKKELFDKIGLLDELFDFYFADNNYAMCLK